MALARRLGRGRTSLQAMVNSSGLLFTFVLREISRAILRGVQVEKRRG